MKVLRRIYVYGIAGIALALAVVGTVHLLELVIDQIWTIAGGRSWVEGGDDWGRRQLSLFLPFVVIATPIWILHWSLAERARRGDEAEEERRSTVRALFLTIALAATFQYLIIEATTVLPILFKAAFGADLPAHERTQIPLGIGAFIVAPLLWLFHWRVRERDAEAGPLTGAAGWLPRLYLYGFSAVALVMMTTGAAELVELVGDAITGRGENTGVGAWWREPLTSALSLVVIGLTTFVIHWGHTLRLVARHDWRGLAERSSPFRPAYLIGTLLVLAVAAITTIQEALANLLRQLLGVARADDAIDQAVDIAGPLVFVVPFVLMILYQRHHLLSEGRRYEGAWKPLTGLQLYGYGLSALGLAFAAIGSVSLGRIVFDLLSSDAGVIARPDDWWRGQLASAFGILSVGLALWLWHWLAISQRTHVSPETERQSTVRQAYLFLVFGASTIALIIAAAITAYLILERALGVTEAGRLLADLSEPLSACIVALMIGAYHGNILRQEVSLSQILERGEPAERPRRLELILEGPPDGDLSAIAHSLAAQVPAGYRLHPRGQSED